MMTEMIVFEDNVSRINSGLWDLAIFFIIGAIILFLAYIFKFNQTKLSVFTISSLALLIVFVGAVHNWTLRHTYDYLTDNRATIEVEFNGLVHYDRRLCYKEDGKPYFFLVNGTEKEEIINENFAGKRCELEYYKLSKIVLNIKVLE